MIRRKRSTPESPVENLTGTKKQERNRKRQSSWKSPSVITVCSLSSIALSGHLFRPWRSFSRFKSERQYPRVFQSFNDTTRGRKIRHPMSENTDLFIKKAFRRGTYADVWEVDDCRGRDWQRMNPITCNSIFEIDWRELKGLAHGGWRDVWLSNFTEPVVLKSLLFENDFTERNIDRHRRDAVALERLTRSPHVMDIYGYCGNSGLFEFAAGKSLWEVIAPDEYETNPPRNQWSKLEKLRMGKFSFTSSCSKKRVFQWTYVVALFYFFLLKNDSRSNSQGSCWCTQCWRWYGHYCTYRYNHGAIR